MNIEFVKNYKMLLSLVLSLFLLACSEGDKSRTLKTLNVAVIPHQNEAVQRSKYQPLISHIEEETGIPSKLHIPDSYEQLLEWFVTKKVDMALFGGVTYVQAHLKANAFPLVMRDVDSKFKSVVLVQAKNAAKNLNDLKNTSFLFGSRLSTSGHLMPRYFFQKKNIIAESYFSEIKYTGAHDRTAEWVRDGKANAGVLNSSIVKEMFADGRLTQDNIKLIWESPSYADYVWAIQADIDKKQKNDIRDVFMHLNQKEEDVDILKKLGATYYIPASHEDFINLEKIVLQMDKKV